MVQDSPAWVYERRFVPALFGPWGARLVEAARISPGGRVLDVACGSGIVARLALAAAGPAGRVAGLDLSAAMLDVARTVSPPAIEFHEGSALALPFPDGSFDVVLCQHGLQFFPDRVQAAREMLRVLAPGGRAVVSVWRSTEHNLAFRPVERLIQERLHDPSALLPPFALHDREQVREVFTAAGAGTVTIRAELGAIRFPSIDEMVDVLAIAGQPFMGRFREVWSADPEGVRALIAAAATPYLDDEGVTLPQAAWVLTATPAA